jgi:environmental stress-induced protein Ves
LQIIRKSSFTAAPWKNGGGTTLEAIRVPPIGDTFRWRVSVANIEASGRFSDFAGYRRNMVLLKGSGLALKIGHAETQVLRQVGEMAQFDGAASVYCELLAGPCVDLNLMVANSTRSAAQVVPLDTSEAAHIVRGMRAESTLIVSIEESLMIESDAGEITKLDPWDLAILAGSDARLRQMHAGRGCAPGTVFVAAISD